MKIYIAFMAAIIAVTAIFVTNKTAEPVEDPVPHLETIAVSVPSVAPEKVCDPMEEINKEIINLVTSKEYTIDELDSLIEKRNTLIIENNLNDIQLSNGKELLDFCRIVAKESSDTNTTDRHIDLVISVILNRVRSSAFPDSISGVIWQKGQYSPTFNKTSFEKIEFSDNIVERIFAMLDDHRICPEKVVFQSNFKQGSGTFEIIRVEAFKGTNYYKSYFCYDNYDRPCYAEDPYYLP